MLDDLTLHLCHLRRNLRLLRMLLLLQLCICLRLCLRLCLRPLDLLQCLKLSLICHLHYLQMSLHASLSLLTLLLLRLRCCPT